MNSQQNNAWKAFKSKGLSRHHGEHLGRRLLDTWKVFSEDTTCSCLAFVCFFSAALYSAAHSEPVVIFQRLVWTTNSPLVWPPSRSHSKLGAWEDVLQWAKGSCTAAHVFWCQLYCSHSLSSWSAVTRHQGNYSRSCHSRDKIRKNRYSLCCSE